MASRWSNDEISKLHSCLVSSFVLEAEINNFRLISPAFVYVVSPLNDDRRSQASNDLHPEDSPKRI